MGGEEKLPESEARRALERLEASREFAASVRTVEVLRYLLERTLAGDAESLKETVLGVEVFHKAPGYNPKEDPTVRVEVRRLRLKLQEYYLGSGAAEPLRFDIPKGAYRLSFTEAAVPAAANVVSPHPAPAFRRKAWLWALAALGVLLIPVAASLWQGGQWGQWVRPGETSPVRQLSAGVGYARTPRISPNGNQVVYAFEESGRRSRICVQGVDDGAARFLTDGAAGDYEPAWSPDGKRLAFIREEGAKAKLMAVTLADGALADLGAVALRAPMDWSPDGEWIAFTDRTDDRPSRIVLCSSRDGRRKDVTPPGLGRQGDGQPRFSPDGKMLAFVRSEESSVQDVFVMDLKSGTERRLTFERKSVEGLTWDAQSGVPLASLQRSGSVRSLWRIPLGGGEPERVAEGAVGAASPDMSRSGRVLTYSIRTVDTNVWRARVDGKEAPAQVTDSIQLDTSPDISPDGRLIAFRSARDGANEIWVSEFSGAHPRKVTAMNGPTTGSPRWSPDGRWIVFDSRPGGNGDIFIVAAEGGAARAVTREPSNEVVPSWSRDGRWIYFASDRNGEPEIWRTGADGNGRAEQLTAGGGFAPVESADGQWLYYTKRRVGGIWRFPLAVGKAQEQFVTMDLKGEWWGHWAIGKTGLYFTIFETAGRKAIDRIDLKTGSRREALRLTRQPVRFDKGLSLSADEQWLSWAQLDRGGSDVYVVKGVR